ncbi:MAG: hypothetical protein N3A54_04790, partial [Patescibacteria group bacterium]|nr:hypothetical protein [Patescibacteria group bacterium]
MKIDEIDNTLRETLPRATGPVFIGRAKKGPIFKPIFVTSAKELVDIFGQPEPGNGANGDVWRNGDCLAPMYGLYAAYAFLQNHDALTFVRVAGDEHPTRTSGVGEAGWITTRTNYSDTDKKDGGAYAFFVGGVQASEGTLSVIYDTSLNGNCSIGGNISKSLLVKWENTLGVQIKISNSSSSPNRYQVGVWDGSSYVYDTTERNITTTTVPLLYGTVDTGLTISFTSLIGYTLNDTATATQTVSYSLDSNLGAIFYVDEGALALEGKDLNGNPVVGNAGFVVSTGPDYEFTLRTYKNAVNKNVYNQKISFNFNNRSSKYIRKVFNTNPTLVNEDITKTENVVNFWLGESFRSQVYKSVAKDSLEIVGCLLKIEKDGVSGANHLAPFKPAETGWIFSQCLDADGPGVYGSGVPGQYDPRKMKKLFKFHSIDGGSWFHANVKISIDRIRYSKSRLTPFGSFDVVVRAAHDTDKNPIILEMFSNCNLDVNSANFIMKKIGDVHYEWDAEEKRYVKYGSYENNSKYIYVEVDQ